MIGLEGSGDLIRKLNSISNEAKYNILKEAIGYGVQVVRREAVLLCPVDRGELRQSIKTSVEIQGDEVKGITYTNKSYAPYVEFGTGPVGEENHSGISPEVTPSYSQQGWGYQKEDGDWVYTNGQPAQPFMYPALKNNENKVLELIEAKIAEGIRELI